MRVTPTIRDSENSTHSLLFPILQDLHACGPAQAALASRITQGSAGMTPSPRQGLGRVQRSATPHSSTLARST